MFELKTNKVSDSGEEDQMCKLSKSVTFHYLLGVSYIFKRYINAFVYLLILTSITIHTIYVNDYIFTLYFAGKIK